MPGLSDVIRFVLVAAIVCMAIGGVRLMLARRAAQTIDSAAPPAIEHVSRPRRFRARLWAGVGGSMTGYAGVMLAGSIALRDGVQPLWVALLVVGVGCVAWSSHIRRQDSSPIA